MALVSQTSVLLASAGQSTKLTVLMHWVYDPVDAGILQHACCCCWPLLAEDNSSARHVAAQWAHCDIDAEPSHLQQKLCRGRCIVHAVQKGVLYSRNNTRTSL